jgi:hypothetical protein
MVMGQEYKITMETIKPYFIKKGFKDDEIPHYMIHNYIVDQQGDELVLAEKTTLSIPDNVNSSSNSKSYYAANLSNPAYISIGPDGKERYGKVIPYMHSHIGTSVTYLRMNAAKGHFEWPVGEFDGTYMGLIAGKSANYILMNNIPANIDKTEDEDPVFYSVKNIDPRLTTCLYTIDFNGATQKEYLFGKPTTENVVSALLHTSDYDAETGLYVTQVIEKVNGEKQVRILWTHLK